MYRSSVSPKAVPSPLRNVRLARSAIVRWNGTVVLALAFVAVIVRSKFPNGQAGSTIAPAHPVLVDVHHEEAVRRPHGVHLALAVAQRLVVRVRPAAVHVLEMVRALERLHPVRRQVHAFDLNEGREHLPTDVR